MDLHLTGKRVLVSGASRGIGLAIAHAFAAEGARLGLVARNRDALQAAADQLVAAGYPAPALYAADLAEPHAAAAAVAHLAAALGGIDILVNSAGAAKRHPPQSLDAEKWQAALHAKFFPYIHTQDAVLAHWRARVAAGETLGGAAVVNIVGTGGKQPTPTHLAGGAANAALLLASVGLAEHYAALGVRINAINPGFTYTGRVDQAITLEAERLGISKAQALRDGEQRIPLGRYGTPEEVANVALFLASSKASYVTGAIVPVHGGAGPVV